MCYINLELLDPISANISVGEIYLNPHRVAMSLFYKTSTMKDFAFASKYEVVFRNVVGTFELEGNWLFKFHLHSYNVSNSQLVNSSHASYSFNAATFEFEINSKYKMTFLNNINELGDKPNEVPILEWLHDSYYAAFWKQTFANSNAKLIDEYLQFFSKPSFENATLPIDSIWEFLR